MAIRYWCQDETRVGLKTIARRRITAKGVKPVGRVQWEFKAFWLYGVVEPKTGESLFWEFSHLDQVCFGQFLQVLSQTDPESFHILQVDNSPAHTASELELPANVGLLFQPPHSPQLNPIERLWRHLKDQLAWRIWPDLNALRLELAQLLRSLSAELIASLTGWDFILNALSVAGI